ncbi:MAG TPA: exosome complex RNA-binding protein Rrp4 [Nitrososphaerales archaeon]|nr:exosome complex RNA-binding protein Rrp4 [Nitrososphaerales archaeon]
MPEIKRKYVIPGEVVARGNVRADLNVMRVDDQLIATRVGMAEIGHDVVRVIALSGPYIPRIDDLVVGKIIDYSAFAWEVDINSCFFGILPAASVFGRDYSPAKDSLTDKLRVGDMIASRVIAFDRTRDPLLSISGPGLGRIPRGQVVKISPAKVPRLIGKKGSMIKTIEAGTKSRMLIGQNGVVVIVGSPDDTIRAIRAVNLVEEEAHSPDLTERVQTLLGITVEPQSNESQESSEGELEQTSDSSEMQLGGEQRETQEIGTSEIENHDQSVEGL